MIIRQLVNKYLSSGYSLRDAQNLAAEEIFLKKIASSDLANHVTLKGGIVMYNLTKNDRRVTQDIDFDLIRYSIDKDYIRLFIDKMNRTNDGIVVTINNQIEDLNQEDYKGVRVNVSLIDKDKDVIKLKLDIGVHTYSAIEQSSIIFNFDSDETGVSIKVNPPEQIFAEKMISLARLGAISTRYKDLYDFYYLIKVLKISAEKVSEILKLFLDNSKKKPNSMFELQNSIEDTLNNKYFASEASRPASNWIDVSFEEVRQTILDFISNF